MGEKRVRGEVRLNEGEWGWSGGEGTIPLSLQQCTKGEGVFTPFLGSGSGRLGIYVARRSFGYRYCLVICWCQVTERFCLWVGMADYSGCWILQLFESGFNRPIWSRNWWGCLGVCWSSASSPLFYLSLLDILWLKGVEGIPKELGHTVLRHWICSLLTI